MDELDQADKGWKNFSYFTEIERWWGWEADNCRKDIHKNMNNVKPA